MASQFDQYKRIIKRDSDTKKSSAAPASAPSPEKEKPAGSPTTVSAARIVLYAILAAAVIFGLRSVVSPSSEGSVAVYVPDIVVPEEEPDAPVYTDAPMVSDSSSYTQAPTVTEPPVVQSRSGPGPQDMEGCDSRIYVPLDSSWLSDYQIKYVDGYSDKRIIVRANPYGKAQSNNIGYINEKKKVTVLPEENDLVLVSVGGRCVGWVNPDYLVDVYTNAHHK